MVSNVVLLNPKHYQDVDIDVDADDFDFSCESHRFVYDQNMGWELDLDEWSVGFARRKALEYQTNKLADLLEESGVEARMKSDVVAISAVTDVVTPLVTFRPIRFLPSVAARDRRPMLNALKYWMANVVLNPEYIRYVVITSGSLVPAYGDLRGRLKELSRKVSRWASLARKEYSIIVHFRGSEFTRKTAAERGIDGYEPDTVLYHPHCNILLEPLEKLPAKGKGSWDEFLKWSHEFLDGHWEDCGRIKDVREIVKYVVKPADLLEGERPIDSDETRWLYESLSRLNLAQPMGEFKKFYSELAEKRVKAVLVKNQNNDHGTLKLVRKSERLNHSDKAPKDNSPGSEPTNILLGVTLPSWTHSPWAEPSILVKNYDPKTISEASIERLRDIRIEQYIAREKWDKSGAPDPAIALVVAKLWASRDGKKVEPLKKKKDPYYSIYNSSLTVPNEERESSDTPLLLKPKSHLELVPKPDPDPQIEDPKQIELGEVDKSFKKTSFRPPELRNKNRKRTRLSKFGRLFPPSL